MVDHTRLDMGLTVKLDQQTVTTSDCVDLLQLVKDFADQTELSSDQGWAAFSRMLTDDTNYESKERVIADFVNIWNTWDITEKGKNNVTQWDRIRMKALFRYVKLRR